MGVWISEPTLDVEHILGDLHPEYVGGVVDVSRVVRAALQAAAKTGALLGQVILSGEVIDEPTLVEAQDGPAARTRIGLTDSSPTKDTTTTSWLDSEPVVVEVVAYGQLALNVTRSCAKGTPDRGHRHLRSRLAHRLSALRRSIKC